MNPVGHNAYCGVGVPVLLSIPVGPGQVEGSQDFQVSVTGFV